MDTEQQPQCPRMSDDGKISMAPDALESALLLFPGAFGSKKIVSTAGFCKEKQQV